MLVVNIKLYLRQSQFRFFVKWFVWQNDSK